MINSATNLISILLVDDHAVVRAGLRMIIESQPDMQMAGEAGDCAMALDLAAKAQPDVILLDLDLGDSSGVDMISGLLEIVPDVRIIILTGLRDPELHRRAVMLGAMGVVAKDKAAEVLIKAIHSVQAGGAWLDPAIMAGVLAEVSRTKKGQSQDPEAVKIATLTNREREVVTLIGEGMKNREIADRLFISETTVRHHLTSIFSKLELNDRVELLIYAYKHGLANLPN